MTLPRASAPPSGLYAKFIFYQQKYGLLHATGGYVGRLLPGLWKHIGPVVTHGYLRRWKQTEEWRLLNLGGGSNCLLDCLTVDIDARSDAYVELTRPLPFDDASVHAVFCEEVIEHLERPAGRRLLRECWRILVPGGILRLTTPDLGWFAHRLPTGPDGSREMNSIFYDHKHRCIYTREAIQCCCREAGFAHVHNSVYQDPTSRLGYLDSHADRFHHPPEMCQYLEAEK